MTRSRTLPAPFLLGFKMRTIENWRWAFASKIGGLVNNESFLSLPVIRVDEEKKVVEVKGGEVFQLGEKAEDSEPLGEVARVVNARYEGGVR